MSGEDGKTFIMLKCYTGLRISDAATSESLAVASLTTVTLLMTLFSLFSI
jgi:hypothetical protein